MANPTWDGKVGDPVPTTDALDSFLAEVVRALHAAVAQGFRSLDTQPSLTDKVLAECRETLAVIMAGHAREWVNS